MDQDPNGVKDKEQSISLILLWENGWTDKEGEWNWFQEHLSSSPITHEIWLSGSSGA